MAAVKAKKNVKKHGVNENVKERGALDAIDAAVLSAAEIVATKLAVLRNSPKCDPGQVSAWAKINKDLSETMKLTRDARGGNESRIKSAEEFAAEIRLQVEAAESLPKET